MAEQVVPQNLDRGDQVSSLSTTIEGKQAPKLSEFVGKNENPERDLTPREQTLVARDQAADEVRKLESQLQQTLNAVDATRDQIRTTRIEPARQNLNPEIYRLQQQLGELQTQLSNMNIDVAKNGEELASIQHAEEALRTERAQKTKSLVNKALSFIGSITGNTGELSSLIGVRHSTEVSQELQQKLSEKSAAERALQQSMESKRQLEIEVQKLGAEIERKFDQMERMNQRVEQPDQIAVPQLTAEIGKLKTQIQEAVQRYDVLVVEEQKGWEALRAEFAGVEGEIGEDEKSRKELFVGYAGEQVYDSAERILGKGEEIRTPNEVMTDLATVAKMATEHVKGLSNVSEKYKERKVGWFNKARESLTASLASEISTLRANLSGEYGIRSNEEIQLEISRLPGTDRMTQIQAWLRELFPTSHAEDVKALLAVDLRNSSENTSELRKRLKGADVFSSGSHADLLYQELLVSMDKRDRAIKRIMDRQQAAVDAVDALVETRKDEFVRTWDKRIKEMVLYQEADDVELSKLTPTERAMVVQDDFSAVHNASERVIDNLKKMDAYVNHPEELAKRMAVEAADILFQKQKLEEELAVLEAMKPRKPERKKAVKQDIEKIQKKIKRLENKASSAIDDARAQYLPIELVSDDAAEQFMFPEGDNDVARLYNVVMHGRHKVEEDSARRDVHGFAERMRASKGAFDETFDKAIKSRVESLQRGEVFEEKKAEVRGSIESIAPQLDALPQQLLDMVSVDPEGFDAKVEAGDEALLSSIRLLERASMPQIAEMATALADADVDYDTDLPNKKKIMSKLMAAGGKLFVNTMNKAIATGLADLLGK